MLTPSVQYDVSNKYAGSGSGMPRVARVRRNVLPNVARAARSTRIWEYQLKRGPQSPGIEIWRDLFSLVGQCGER